MCGVDYNKIVVFTLSVLESIGDISAKMYIHRLKILKNYCNYHVKDKLKKKNIL